MLPLLGEKTIKMAITRGNNTVLIYLFPLLQTRYAEKWVKLIHTDLKPENILLVSSDYVKLNDPKGETLFQTHENLEHLAMMERVLGPLPRHMLERAEYGFLLLLLSLLSPNAA
nr:unnamed protein product [Digitaria exilis]